MTAAGDVAILVPRRAGDPWRDKCWAHAEEQWTSMFHDWPLVVGEHDDGGPFNRSAAINSAALEADRLLGGWDAAVIIDADVLPTPEGILEAVEHALGTDCAASGYDVRYNLTDKGSRRIMDGYKGSWRPFIESSWPDCKSGALAVPRGLWEELGGFDELFVGWGYEDTAFEQACEALRMERLRQVRADLWHLWHHRSPEANHRLPQFRANRTRKDLYADANRRAWSGEGSGPMLEVIAAAKAARGAPALTGSRPALIAPPLERDLELDVIPRILHRTVPEQTTAEVDSWWARAGDLHPTWELMDHRDPLDPADWPETGKIWHHCTSGAQKAGLIRLEALFRWGGVYVDSDVELYRPLDPLLGVQAFAGWEDAKCVPDAVLGSMPEHPAFRIMLDLAIERVLAGDGAWKSGPGVTSAVLPGRADVLLLPPGSFYPYHYKHKVRDRDRDHVGEQPWSFGAHHWHHSWDGA